MIKIIYNNYYSYHCLIFIQVNLKNVDLVLSECVKEIV